MNTKRSIVYAAACLGLLGSVPMMLPSARAGSLTLQDTADYKGIDDGNFERQRFVFTFESRVGYDDNSLNRPDDFRGGRPDSIFINEDIGISYTAVNTRATFGIAADVGINYYFDRPGRDYDANGAITLRGTYKLTPRALIEVSSYNAYESEPDFNASNLTGFTGEVGAGITYPGTSSQRNGDYFFTSNHTSLTYQFTPRISTVTSGDVVAFAFKNEPFATIQDRVELYADEQFLYLLQPTLTAVGEYRFGYINYIDNNSDSFTNFALAGFNYTFNPRLRGEVRGGVEFRNYFDSDNDDTSPYFEGTLSFDLSLRTQLSLVGRYSIEEGDISTQASNSKTFRLGFNVAQQFTKKLTGYLSFYYTHSNYDAEDFSSFDENTFEVATGLRYAFNRRISAEVGYTHTAVVSGDSFREYDRNRYFTGVRFQF